MGWPKGNKYWKLRSTYGRTKKYTPEEVFNLANKYFEYCINNPLKEEVIVNRPWTEIKYVTIKNDKGEDKTVERKITHPFSRTHLNKMRPFTIHGLCNYMEISIVTFRDYASQEAYSSVTTQVKQVIYNQKFEGASAGFFNTNIIARDLGLADKQEVQKNVVKYKNVSKQFPNAE